MSTLYIFYKKDKFNERVIIYANSYLEAKEALFALNNYADLVYDINEYKYQHVDTIALYNELNLSETYEGYPYILTEENYKNIEDSIEDKMFSNIHNTKVLTKEIADHLHADDKNCRYPIYSLDEFKRSMQQMTENKEKQRNMIDDMINHIGDVWYAKIYSSPLRLGPENYVYGRSRKEVLDILNNFDEKYRVLQKEIYLLISSYPDYTEEDIKRYEKFVTYIKEHNIKKLPFITNY